MVAPRRRPVKTFRRDPAPGRGRFRATINALVPAQDILAGLSVVAGLIVLEGLLSVDNVLGIAALANELPASQQRLAIRVGLGLAYLFRVLALLVASWLATNTWVRWVGAGYLIWLMSSHLTKGHAHDVAERVEHQAEVEDEAPPQAPQRQADEDLH